MFLLINIKCTIPVNTPTGKKFASQVFVSLPYSENDKLPFVTGKSYNVTHEEKQLTTSAFFKAFAPKLRKAFAEENR